MIQQDEGIISLLTYGQVATMTRCSRCLKTPVWLHPVATIASAAWPGKEEKQRYGIHVSVYNWEFSILTCHKDYMRHVMSDITAPATMLQAVISNSRVTHTHTHTFLLLFQLQSHQQHITQFNYSLHAVQYGIVGLTSHSTHYRSFQKDFMGHMTQPTASSINQSIRKGLK